MTCNHFVHKNNLKKNATSKLKIYRVLSSLSLNDTAVYLRDGSFWGDIGTVYSHPSKGTHWVCDMNENYFDLYGCAPRNKLSRFNIKRNGHCLFSENKIQGLSIKRDSYWASYCLYIIHLTKVLGIDFKSAVLNLYYRMIW